MNELTEAEVAFIENYPKESANYRLLAAWREQRKENGRLREVLREIESNCGCCEDMEPCANCRRIEAALQTKTPASG